MVGLKGLIKNILFLSVAILMGHVILASYKSTHIRIGECGSIIARSNDAIQGATTERVVFYPHGGSYKDKKIERNGLLVVYPDAQATILICHGFMCDKFDAGLLRRLFPRGKFNIMSFDFRAHGEKTCGQYCTLGTDEKYDVIAAARFLKNHPKLQGKPLFVYGFSMGAVAAIAAQEKDGSLFDAMILDCPFASAANVIKRGLENLKLTICGHEFAMPGREILQKYAFHPYVQYMLRMVLKAVAHMDSRNIAMRVFPIDPIKMVEHIKVPVLYILCKKDEKVSVEDGKALFYTTGSDYKILRITNGRRHFDSYFYAPEAYTSWVRDFLDAVLNGSTKKAHQEIIEDEDDSLEILKEGEL